MHSLVALRRIRALWTTGAILAVASTAPSQEAPPAVQTKSIETQRREALKNRHTVDEYGEYGLIARTTSVFPIKELSKELKVKAGAVSLLADLKDHGGERTAVYLLNATSKLLEKADSRFVRCFMEVKDGDHWLSVQDATLDCGTGIPEPKDLAPGHARLLFGWDPTVGDKTGELRYCVTLPHGRPVVSASFQGHYSSEARERKNRPGGLASKAIANGLDGKGWSEVPDYISGGMLHSAEECLAAAELDRIYDESLLTKNALIRWKAAALPREEMDRCHAALEKLLKSPWNHRKDAASFFLRCHAALTGSHEKGEFGSPENCRAVVWQYLEKIPSRLPEHQVNPERWDQLEAIRRSGNPWGVENELVVAVIEEAIASLRSPDVAEREAAGSFLGGTWIRPDQLPDERLWFMLDHDVASARKTALSVLSLRGKSEQAGKWLADHPQLPGSELKVLWEWTAPYRDRGKFAGWEIPVGLRLLETSPLEAADTLARRVHLIKEAGGKMPDEFRDPLRRFLVKEAEAQQATGPPPLKPGEEPDTMERMVNPRINEPGYLSSALYLLAEWNDPADTPLFKSYLTHPAGIYWTSPVTRDYKVRSTAARLLEQRNEKVPEGIVFEEKVK